VTSPGPQRLAAKSPSGRRRDDGLRAHEQGRQTPRLLSTTAVLLVLVLATAHGLSRFSEPDLWWHLRVGDWIRAGHGLVWPDPSARFAVRDYTATQWLPEVVVSSLYSVLGIGGVLWLRTLALLGLTSAAYASCRRYAGRLPSALVAGATLLGSGGGLNPRPQLVSFVLFAMTVLAWYGTARDRQPRWWLVPVFWLWACSHGLWALGLALGGLVLVALAMDAAKRHTARLPTTLWVLWFSCLGAVALTPIGPRLLLTPFQVGRTALMVADEWRPTPFNNVFSIAALAMVLLCAVLWATRPRPREPWQIAALAFGALATLWMWRLVPLGAIAVAPLLAQSIQERLSAARERVTRSERRALTGAATGLALAALLVSSGPLGAVASRYPEGVAPVDRALSELPPGTVVMDDFGISGWLLWAHPELTPVADLRGEIYGARHLARYRAALAGEPGWHDFVVATRAGAALLQQRSPLSDALVHRSGWVPVASTEDFVLLEPGSAR
jgi:hypothetical protein